MITRLNAQVGYVALFIFVLVACRGQENSVHPTIIPSGATLASPTARVVPSATLANVMPTRTALTLLPASADELLLGNLTCKLPCWGGVIIGKTSLDDAYSLLNPTLELDALRSAACRLGQCKWYPWIHTFGDKSYSGAVLSKEEEIVYAIVVEGDYSEDVSFPRLMSLYGNPSKTFVYAHAGMPPDNIAPFDLILLYSQEQFVVRYRWLTQSSGERIEACGLPQYFTLSAIQHAEAEWTNLEIDQAAHQLK